MSQVNLSLGGKEILLLGTAHVSQASCDEVKAAIIEKKTDVVAIELDEQRFASLNDSESWKNLDIIKVLKEKKGFLLLANLVLASFQKRMGATVGVKPGDEMRAGIEAAKELSIPCEMVDRPIQMTLRRAWAKNSGYGKMKLLSALLASAMEKEEVSGEEIENLKSKSEMDGMMNELAEFMPEVKTVLIDERDFYLAAHIWEAVQRGERKSVIAVLGAGQSADYRAYLSLSIGSFVNAYYIYLSLFFTFATLFPDMRVLLFFFIPIKMKWLALVDAALFLYDVIRIQPFAFKLLPVVAVLNYLLFCGDWLTAFLRPGARQRRQNTVRFRSEVRRMRREQAAQPWTRRCEVCGRTDADFPDLEFRYCSRCAGYHCYCIDHINNHRHITQ